MSFENTLPLVLRLQNILHIVENEGPEGVDANELAILGIEERGKQETAKCIASKLAEARLAVLHEASALLEENDLRNIAAVTACLVALSIMKEGNELSPNAMEQLVAKTITNTNDEISPERTPDPHRGKIQVHVGRDMRSDFLTDLHRWSPNLNEAFLSLCRDGEVNLSTWENLEHLHGKHVSLAYPSKGTPENPGQFTIRTMYFGQHQGDTVAVHVVLTKKKKTSSAQSPSGLSNNCGLFLWSGTVATNEDHFSYSLPTEVPPSGGGNHDGTRLFDDSPHSYSWTPAGIYRALGLPDIPITEDQTAILQYWYQFGVGCGPKSDVASRESEDPRMLYRAAAEDARDLRETRAACSLARLCTAKDMMRIADHAIKQWPLDTARLFQQYTVGEETTTDYSILLKKSNEHLLWNERGNNILMTLNDRGRFKDPWLAPFSGKSRR